MTTDTTTLAGRTVRVRMTTEAGTQVIATLPIEWLSLVNAAMRREDPFAGSKFDKGTTTQ